MDQALQEQCLKYPSSVDIDPSSVNIDLDAARPCASNALCSSLNVDPSSVNIDDGYRKPMYQQCLIKQR